MGVVSSNANMEMAQVVYEVLDYEPDLVIFYNGGNDVMMPYYYDPRPGYPFNFSSYEQNVFFNIDDFPAIALFTYKSNLCRILFKQYYTNLYGNHDVLRSLANYRSDSWEDEIVRQYVGACTKTKKISVAFGSDFAVFYNPLCFTNSIAP